MIQNDIEEGEEELKNCLKSILAGGNLNSHQEAVKQLSSELQISVLECAAALFLLHQPEQLDLKSESESSNKEIKNADLPIVPLNHKSVRYRMEIGQMHGIVVDDIRAVLVEVAGVECSRIERLEIRNHYTLVDLPNGMPADIFQLLSETKINRQKLNLKRIKFQRRTQRRRKRY